MSLTLDGVSPTEDVNDDCPLLWIEVHIPSYYGQISPTLDACVYTVVCYVYYAANVGYMGQLVT